MTYPKPLNGNSFPPVLLMFNVLINIHEKANEMIIIYSHDINTFVILYKCYAITKWHNHSLCIELVNSWVFNNSKPFVMFSLKFMNIQIR